ncbi:protein hid1 isoform x2 [Plasmopara halstedii]|uniref:Protein hid1 isoform x2 n=1 Tax=Plasmopara halstedii TaxID=4781 RepID=A0A0P1B2G1_PLAHL|nr:protein hid1 isoform x2 [Plasmopara halstedii]CEG48448.1 protein hid1 isoform x2 [Plasmopara halstedii]|eukprot:XP_024584817.1 protein hid1 isoform x2 [Plasmopara halstedii]
MGNSDSKSKFRESVYKLNNEIISSKNLEFWDKLWRIPTVAEEIFTLIQPDDVRMLRHQQPENLGTMLKQAVSQIVQIVDTPVPKYYQQALNCVRVLTRLVPFILEEGVDEFVEQLFWSVEDNESPKSDGEDDEIKEERSGAEPLAKQMIHAIMGLLFLPEFTVSIHAYKGYGEERRSTTRSGQSATTGSLVFPSLLWHSGVMYPDASVMNSSSYDRNRKEVLALLLTCFSSILYQTAEKCNQWKDRFLEVATAPDCPFAPTLFYSLLNIVVSYDPVGWGVPYAGSIVSDDRELLVDMSLQVFLVLLDFGQTTESNVVATLKPQSRNTTPVDQPNLSSVTSNPVFDGVPNVYRNLLATLQRPEDFQLIFSVLLWKLLDENADFLHFVLKKADANQLVVPLLFLMYEGRQEPAKVGMIHICTFILLLLSGERDFGVNLNKPFNNHLPLDLPPFSGNHADLLLVCLHKIIVTGYEKLNSVYNCFLTIICNISPYCKKLHMVSAVRLLRLFKLFAQPRYLFDNEANHHLVFFLLEAFDNIIQYQYEGNQQVVYAMVQNKNVFYQLNDLQLPPIREGKKPIKKDGDNDEQEVAPGSECGFVPTVEWLAAWKKRLPLTTSLRLLQHLIPLLEETCKKAGGSLDEDAMLYFLRTTTMVGLLPVPHPIVIRKYQINQFTHLWFTTFTWGVIFLRNQVLPLFDGGAITLFTISVV